MSEKPKRRWCQFSLRALFTLLTVVAGAAAAIGIWAARAERQREAVIRIERLGGMVYYEDSFVNTSWFPRFPPWVPRDYRSSVLVVWLDSTPATDHDVHQPRHLRMVQSLNLINTKVTDVSMPDVGEFANLETLWLRGTEISDAGLENMKRLTRLRKLDLDGTRVTDAGITSLMSLKSLKEVSLPNTVTGRGRVELIDALPSCHVQ